jgi:hypothetical protein
MIHRDEVFYATDKEVQKGDEFYQVVLDSEPDYPQQTPFRVVVFHGQTGNVPYTPETEAFFAKGDEAESGFARTVAHVMEKGFQHYSMAIHGVHNF